MPKILITPRSLSKNGHPALKRLEEAGFELIYGPRGKQPTEEELLELLPECVGYLAGVEKVSAIVLENATDLKVISRNGTGIDSIDREAAERLHVRICKTEGANARGVAELTIGLLFSLVRSIPLSNERMKQKTWERKRGIELEGRLLGLWGCGQIGQEVATIACGMGMRVIAFRRHPDESFRPSNNFNYSSIEELISKSDIISLHRPAEPDGSPIITESVIKKMKKGVYLINTARASLIDEKAVLQALNEGKIAGLGVDVYTEEPPKQYDLVKHERVIATPHLGGYTDESVDRATNAAVDNLLRYLPLP